MNTYGVTSLSFEYNTTSISGVECEASLPESRVDSSFVNCVYWQYAWGSYFKDLFALSNGTRTLTVNKKGPNCLSSQPATELGLQQIYVDHMAYTDFHIGQSSWYAVKQAV